MEPLFPNEDTFATQKIMAVLGALCILYFLFSPLPMQYRDDGLIVYMAKGSGEQWFILGFALLTAVLVYFKFSAVAVFVSICLVLTTVWTTLWSVFHSWLVWALFNASIYPSAITRSALFIMIDRFLFEHLVGKGYVGPIWTRSLWFQNVSVFQTLILVVGTILLLVSSIWQIRLSRNKRKAIEPSIA